MIRLTASLLTLVVVGCAQSPDRTAASSTTRRVTAWDSAVIREVVGMGETDQKAREWIQRFAELDTAAIPKYAAAMDSVDRANTERLKTIIDQHGWPSKPRVGSEAAEAAFLIVQHALHDPVFQKEYLAFLEEEYQGGRGPGEAVALLADRTRQHEGKLQLYGTQLSMKGGKWTLDPIEDEAQVDERRAALGMMPLAEYVAMVKEVYGIKE